MGFVKVGETSDIGPGKVRAYAIGGKEIVLANIDGKFYAMDRYCPHAGGDLSKGSLDGKVITCPRHGSKYDMEGRATVAPPKVAFLKLKAPVAQYYDVKVEGKDVLVKL